MTLDLKLRHLPELGLGLLAGLLLQVLGLPLGLQLAEHPSRVLKHTTNLQNTPPEY